MKIFYFTLILSVSANYAWALPSSGIVRAAEYYYSRQDYRQALQLWAEAVKRKPDDTYAILRLAELKLMLEGKRASQSLLLSALQGNGKQLDAFSKHSLSQKLSHTLAVFVSDEAQSFYLQAKPKLNFNDCEGALTLLRQSLSLEPENLPALREKARCERQLGQRDAYLSTVQSMFSLNPYDPITLEEYFRALHGAKNYSGIVSAHNQVFDAGSTEAKLYLASALVELKSDAEALVILDEVAKEKSGKSSPFVHYLRGKVFSRYKNMKREEANALESFLNQIADSKNSDGISDVDIETKVVESKKRLADLGALFR